MRKVRMLLVAFTLLNILVFVLGVQGFNYGVALNTTENHKVVGQVLSGVSFTATAVPPLAFVGSLVMLVLSFFSLQVTADGRLTYNPENFWWKILGKMYLLNPSMSLCAACWLTAITVFLFFIDVPITINTFIIYSFTSHYSGILFLYY